MESLRWVLLGVGIVFVLVIYFLGRKRKRRNEYNNTEMDKDLPEFSAQNFDDFDEGVGEVRVITGAGLSADSTESIYASSDDGINTQEQENIKEEKNCPPDIVALYILPKPDQVLMGAHINSSAQAMGLKFGEMNIFHYTDGSRTVFSLANMLEPGSFNPETIHELKTTGLTVFMQFNGRDPLDDLTEMLQRSYQLSGLLDARLCNHKRQPLTEQDAENYRKRATNFINGDLIHSPSTA